MWVLDVTFNTMLVGVVLWAEETSTYNWSRFCTPLCRPSISKELPTFPQGRFELQTSDQFRDGRLATLALSLAVILIEYHK